MRKMAAMTLIITLFTSLTGCFGGSAKPTYMGLVESTLLPVNAETGGRVTELLVQEGQEVNVGDILARLDDSAQKIALANAEAQLKQAQAKLNDLLGGSRAEEVRRLQALLDQAKASEASARKNYELEEKNLKDYQALFAAGAISQKDLDVQANKHAAAKAQHESAQAQAAAARASLDLALNGYTNAAIDAQRAVVEAAWTGVDNARLNLEKTVIKSAVKGKVVYKHAELGQVVNPGARVYTLLDPNDLYVNVYVPEAQLNEAAKGRPAALAVDAYPKQAFAGEIVHIAEKAEFTPKNVQTKEERTTLVFKVKVKIKEGLDRLKPGMPADVTFQ